MGRNPRIPDCREHCVILPSLCMDFLQGNYHLGTEGQRRKWEGAFALCADGTEVLLCLWSDGIAGDIIAVAFPGAPGELIQVGEEVKVCVCVCLCPCAQIRRVNAPEYLRKQACMAVCLDVHECVCISHQSRGKPVCKVICMLMAEQQSYSPRGYKPHWMWNKQVLLPKLHCWFPCGGQTWLDRFSLLSMFLDFLHSNISVHVICQQGYSFT